MKNATNLLAGAALFTQLYSCVSSKALQERQIAMMHDQLQSLEGKAFFKNKAAQDFQSNAETFSLDSKDQRHLYLDKFGATVKTRERRLAFDVDHGLVFSTMLDRAPIYYTSGKREWVVPVAFLHQADKKDSSEFDARYNQVKTDNNARPSPEKILQETNRFTRIAPDQIVEDVPLSSTLNAHYKLLYDFKTGMVYGGSAFLKDWEFISTMEDANPQMKEICKGLKKRCDPSIALQPGL